MVVGFWLLVDQIRLLFDVSYFKLNNILKGM